VSGVLGAASRKTAALALIVLLAGVSAGILWSRSQLLVLAVLATGAASLAGFAKRASP
jgi:hypothetical protein